MAGEDNATSGRLREIDTVDVPEIGQIVAVRGANWAVTEVQQQGLTRSSADDAVQQLQHAVSLQSIEDDRLRHELRVARDRRVDDELLSLDWTVLRIWEHEPTSVAVSRIQSALSEA